MNKPRAISAQLVDIRNVGAHKSIKLTIHVPEEQARQVVDLFGWPTMVDPVPVALARLQEGGDAKSAPRKNEPVGRAKRSWDELSAAEQAGIRCNEASFQKFLSETFPVNWAKTEGIPGERAAAFIRQHCGVASRSDINAGNPQALDAWHRLDFDYRAWMAAPAVGAVA